ncbi:triacylglycerol lipase [Streptomyces sp. JJ36]|uniref:esterase/lipase family protein n=1 Tax=Streptomyces sp. JJ36 TaxID=2736645 RepID=UPI001F485B9D|nr:alpha/beta fold hydrolase [Streptomyces sp. JJ36]MCF6521531.1 lipase [Streptomyces sp. JJ36]
MHPRRRSHSRTARIVTVIASLLLAPLLTVPTATAATAAQPDPVLFVHGYKGGAWNWFDMIDDFEGAGYPSDRLHAMSYDPFQSNATTAAQVREEADALRARTGASRIDIVTHSMGGLSSRHYLKFLGGTAHVDDWVSLGGPNHGTNLAGICSWLITSCKELKAGSDFLNRLNAGDETPGTVNYGTFWSSCDEFINPDSSTLLSGATNTHVGCVEHAWLLVSDPVSRATRDFVR